VTAYTDHWTSQVVLRQRANCFRAEMLPRRMFCLKRTLCDRRPVFECRQNAIVWRRRRWRVGSRQPDSLGRGRTDTDERAWRSCSWRAASCIISKCRVDAWYFILVADSRCAIGWETTV